MPPRESTSRPPRNNVYSVLLVVSAAFLFLAIAITWAELDSDYDFMGTAEYGMGPDAEAEEAPAAEAAPEPAAAPEE